jgi:hypothetical protein
VTRPEGCGFGPCQHSLERGGEGCDLCDRVAHIRIVRCVGLTQEEQQPCGLVEHHPGPCKPSGNGKVERPDLKDSEPVPDLTGPRAAAIALGRKRRHRDGPHRGTA